MTQQLENKEKIPEGGGVVGKAGVPFPRRQGRRGTHQRGGGPRRDRDGGSRRSRADIPQKVINMRRVARVVAGGRRFNFSVDIVVGDKKGSAGVGSGKAADTALAIEKALRSAKKNMVKIPLTKTMSIPHEVEAKFSSARVQLIPAKGRGLVAGSAVRTILDMAGVRDVISKVLSPSKNKLNIAKATLKALSELRTR